MAAVTTGSKGAMVCDDCVTSMHSVRQVECGTASLASGVHDERDVCREARAFLAVTFERVLVQYGSALGVHRLR